MRLSVFSNDLPSIGSILISASNELFSDLSKSSNPLNTDKTMISAAVLKAIPAIARIEIMLMKFAFRFEKRYRLAIKKGKFNFF
jgi:hypothetical protein